MYVFFTFKPTTQNLNLTCFELRRRKSVQISIALPFRRPSTSGMTVGRFLAERLFPYFDKLRSLFSSYLHDPQKVQEECDVEPESECSLLTGS